MFRNKIVDFNESYVLCYAIILHDEQC